MLQLIIRSSEWSFHPGYPTIRVIRPILTIRMSGYFYVNHLKIRKYKMKQNNEKFRIGNSSSEEILLKYCSI